MQAAQVEQFGQPMVLKELDIPTPGPGQILVRPEVKEIQSPKFRERMDEIGAEPIGNSCEQMAQQIRVETDKFAGLVKEAKVRRSCAGSRGRTSLRWSRRRFA